MAKFAYIQSKSATAASGATISAVFNGTPVQNNLLVAGVHQPAGGTITMSSSGWTALTNSSATNFSLRMFWKIAGTSESTTVTATVPASGSASDIAVAEYQAADTISSLNVENSKTNASTNALASPSVVPYANAVLMVAYGGTFSGSAVFSNRQIGSTTTGVNTRETTTSVSNATLFDKVVGMPSGGYTATASSNLTSNCGMGIAVFNLLVNSANNYEFVSVGDGMSSSERIR